MSTAQMLLRGLLDEAGGAAESGYMLVLDSEGLEDLPPRLTTARATYSVCRVATEIGLRYLLWKAQGAPLIAVVPEPLAHQIQKAPDLLRRAHKRQVHALTVNDVLQTVLGVRVVGADAPHLQQLAIDHLDQLSRGLSLRTLPTVVDRKLLTELLLDVSVGAQVRTRTPAELLAGWLTDPPHWPDDVVQLVRDAMPTLHGDQGRLLAWALGDPDECLAQLMVHSAVLTVAAPEVPKKAWGPLWHAAIQPPVELDRRVVRRAAVELVEATLTELGDAASSLLDRADRVGRESMTMDKLQTSPVLPLAFADRCLSLAKQAARGRAIAATDVEWLANHRAAPMRSSDLAVIQAMGRLSRYLDQPFVRKSDVLEQVRDYQHSSAFADLAALQLRRALASNAGYHDQAGKVLKAVRVRRDRENLHFARTLAAGYEAALHHPGVTPLHRLWKRTIAPFWQEQEHANEREQDQQAQARSDAGPGDRLYLVVLDGCSYPVFLELLYALAQNAAFPLGVAPDAQGRVAGIPALAPLPTITSHARGAIFLGELPDDPLVAETAVREQEQAHIDPRDNARTDTTIGAKTDKARFKQNRALGERTRQLFLKGDLTDGGQALRTALRSGDVDVVAAVFNAVDDQISSANTGATIRLVPEDIAGFLPSLKAALAGGRRVLLTADHGHSPFVDSSLRVGAGKAPRFVRVNAEEPAPEGFLEIDLASLGGPPARRAFAWRSGAYMGGQQVGFHGGCSLEEMVVPLAWIARDGLQADEPSWWFGGGVMPEPARPAPLVEPPIVTPLPSPPRPAVSQLSLFDPSQKADLLPVAAGVLERLSSDQKSVLVLLKENGSARASELADRLNKSPGRLNGLMRTLRRTLHAEGVVLFSDEVLPSGETLYRYQPPEGS
ncbi:MAG: BREX-2 system phosphatase PglZ [Proteobacteria bacterium]|nr:BREX-2 system phosphatase PglZ [Pseudomonadota bacterium]